MMTTRKFTEQLEAIAHSEDFPTASALLTEAWSAAGVGLESVEPILQFMEEHPAIEYGMPGSLVHFVEEFYLKGYEERLVESICRRPTMVTIWMLNRIINGTSDSIRRHELVETMRKSVNHLKCDQPTRALIEEFLNDRTNDN